MTDHSEGNVEERKQFIRDFIKKNLLETSGAALYQAIIDRYPDITPGGHRGMVGRMYPDKPWDIEKECPNIEKGTCEPKTKAIGMAQALELFGHRMKKTQLQSYCRDCRNRHRREQRAKRKAKKKAAEQAEMAEAAE